MCVDRSCFESLCPDTLSERLETRAGRWRFLTRSRELPHNVQRLWVCLLVRPGCGGRPPLGVYGATLSATLHAACRNSELLTTIRSFYEM